MRPRRTIRVALWGGEEQGLLGSRAWVAQHLAGAANSAARDKFDADGRLTDEATRKQIVELLEALAAYARQLQKGSV